MSSESQHERSTAERADLARARAAVPRIHRPRPDRVAHDDRPRPRRLLFERPADEGRAEPDRGRQGGGVLAMRRSFQEAMREDLVAEVERITGRKVTAFMSANHLEPDHAIESYVLDGPAAAPLESV